MRSKNLIFEIGFETADTKEKSYRSSDLNINLLLAGLFKDFIT
jgi:hypothetical protein